MSRLCQLIEIKPQSSQRKRRDTLAWSGSPRFWPFLEARMSHGSNTDETPKKRARSYPCFFSVSSVAKPCLFSLVHRKADSGSLATALAVEGDPGLNEEGRNNKNGAKSYSLRFLPSCIP